MGEAAREAMGAKFDELEAVPEVEADEPVIEAGPENEPDAADDGVVEAPEEPSGKTRDESGKFTKAKAPIVTKRPQLGEKTVTAPGKPGVITPTKAPIPGTTTQTELKPPSSWKPEAREKWAALPQEVQREAVRLDREVRQAMQQAAEKSKGYEAMTQAAAPYQAMIQASGADLPTVTRQLLSTAYELQYGPPNRKAQLISHFIKSYGLNNEDGIKLLAAELDGQPGQAQPQYQQQQPQYRDPRVDQMLAQMQQAKQQHEGELSQAAASSIEEFAQGKEFFDDVKELMGELQETAGKKGRLLDLDKAYTIATQMHPDVSRVLQERAARSSANAVTASTQRAKLAASSIKGAPSMGNGAGGGKQSRWEVLSDKYDEMLEQ